TVDTVRVLGTIPTGHNTVAGNLIGLTAAGTAAVPNGGAGVGITAGAADNTIGGTTAAARNVISGNTTSGVEIADPGTTGNAVQGVYISHASNTLIGGTTPGARNVIAGTRQFANYFDNGNGISITNGTGNVVQGNYIGTDRTGAAVLGNATGGVGLTDGSG